VKPAKAQALALPSAVSSRWSWWCRYRLPSLLRVRLYWADLDGTLWVTYEGREPKLLALAEVMPLGGSLEARRASLEALRLGGALIGEVHAWAHEQGL
jgi:hypothetical protein